MKMAFEDGRKAITTGSNAAVEFWRQQDPRLYLRCREGKGAGLREAAMMGKAGNKGKGKADRAGGARSTSPPSDRESETAAQEPPWITAYKI